MKDWQTEKIGVQGTRLESRSSPQNSFSFFCAQQLREIGVQETRLEGR